MAFDADRLPPSLGVATSTVNERADDAATPAGEQAGGGQADGAPVGEAGGDIEAEQPKPRRRRLRTVSGDATQAN